MIPIKRIFYFLALIIYIININVHAEPSVMLNTADYDAIIQLLAACADIPEYDRSYTDKDELMRRVLYTHRNFKWITDVPPGTAQGHNSLTLCSGNYISDIMHTAFRIAPEQPKLNELTRRGYCYSNGMYYWSGGYTRYFATQVHDIVSARYADNDTLVVVFTDTYIESGSKPIEEYSSASFMHDSEGWYLTSIHMGQSNINPTNPPAAVPAPESPIFPLLRRCLPWFTALLSLTGAGIILYVFILKNHY